MGKGAQISISHCTQSPTLAVGVARSQYFYPAKGGEQAKSTSDSQCEILTFAGDWDCGGTS